MLHLFNNCVTVDEVQNLDTFSKSTDLVNLLSVDETKILDGWSQKVQEYELLKVHVLHINVEVVEMDEVSHLRFTDILEHFLLELLIKLKHRHRLTNIFILVIQPFLLGSHLGKQICKLRDSHSRDYGSNHIGHNCSPTLPTSFRQHLILASHIIVQNHVALQSVVIKLCMSEINVLGRNPYLIVQDHKCKVTVDPMEK